MRIARSILAALILLAAGALPVAADHGYWPAGGVEPAVVAGHQPRTPDNASAADWGTDCMTLGLAGTEGPALDPYGHVLEADHAIAVVLAAREGVPLDGPHAVTVFRNPKAGEFVWADADGDGSFAGRHEADAGELILCPGAGLPATDAVVAEGESVTGAQSGILWVVAVACGLAVLAGRARGARS